MTKEQTVNFTCDRCGAKEEAPTWSEPAKWMSYSGDDGHLCETCKADFKAWVKAGVVEEDPPHPQPLMHVLKDWGNEVEVREASREEIEEFKKHYMNEPAPPDRCICVSEKNGRCVAPALDGRQRCNQCIRFATTPGFHCSHIGDKA